MTPGEMEAVVLLLLAVLFLAALVSTNVLIFFRPWLILRSEWDQHQDLESAASEPQESSEMGAEAPDGSERGVPSDGERRSWWRRLFT